MEYLNKIIKSEENITINEIKDIEEKYGFKFPKDVEKYYLQYNGGNLEKHFYIKGDTRYWFDFFCPIKYTEYSMESALDIMDENNKPKWLIPFGYDPGGDLFCFSIKRGERGKIYYVRHEYYGIDTPKDGIDYLCDNLTEFINEMVDEE